MRSLVRRADVDKLIHLRYAPANVFQSESNILFVLKILLSWSSIKWHRIGGFTQDLHLCSPVLLDIIMSLDSLFANILSQDEDPADSVPTDDDVTEGIQPPACMIL